MVLEEQCFHGIGAFGSHLLKVSALKLFHPSACSVFQSFSHFSRLRHKLLGERRWVKSGFTLIEVVVSLAILSVGLIVIIELFAGGLRLARVSEEYTKAVNYGRIKMEEIAVKPKMEEGSEEGEFDKTFRWEVGVKKVDVLPIEQKPDLKVPVELFQIQVKVIWKSGSKERSSAVETYKMIRVEEDEKKS
jgi:prepilin-type N-terminal cleavage/methylation domain-containing protein